MLLNCCHWTVFGIHAWCCIDVVISHSDVINGDVTVRPRADVCLCVDPDRGQILTLDADVDVVPFASLL